MTKSFNTLVNRLNIFRRKYYILKIIRGLLLTLLISLIAYTFVSVVEYFAFLPSKARTFIFYFLIVLFVILLIQFIIIPVFKLLRITNQIGYKKVNQIIVDFFPDIKDKLLNILELSKIENSNYSDDIIWASVDQKINDIKVFNFQKVISFRQLRFILFYVFISTGVIVGIVILDKPVITESNYRIINYDKTFTKPAPFKFILLNKNLLVNKGDEYSIQLKCEGESFPQVVYINIEGNNFLMKKKDDNIYEYYIESVINSFDFYFTDLKFFSNSFKLNTLPKPGILDFNLKISPPKYTNISYEIVENTGDVKIPAGSKLEWNFNCIDTDSLYILFNESGKNLATINNNRFSVEKTIIDNSLYNIFIKNSHINYKEVLSYSVSVIPDLFPEINVVQSRDSFLYSRFYFKGSIVDDYGFTALNFHYNINNNDSIIPLEVIGTLINQDFYFTIDFSKLVSGSEDVSYYFSISDNDKVNGYKTVTSNSYVFSNPSGEEIVQHDKEQFSNIEEMVAESQQLAKEIKEGIEELQYKNLDSKISEWEKSQLVNEIVNKKNALEELFEKVKEQNSDLNNFMNSFTEQNQEIFAKQEQLEELLNEVFSDELKELMEEFSKLAEEFNEQDFNKLSEELDMSFDDLSKQLDRNLEMLRKMKVEQKLQNIVDKMYELGDKEEQLAEEIFSEKNYDQVKEKDQLNRDELNELQKSLEDALKINNDLKKPLNFDNFEDEFENLEKGFDKNKLDLDKRSKKKSSQSIKNTSEQIKSLAFNMDQLLQSNIMEQNMESIENIRQILSNLIYFSFSQEDILNRLVGIDVSDPELNSLKRLQNNLKDQSGVIKDSLYALANRTPEVSNMISTELLAIELNLNKTEDKLEESLLPSTRVSQQFVVTATNNLALMLNDALDALENQMANKMKGDQECENPNGKGKGGQNMDMLKKSSEGMKEKLQQMIEEMKKGNSKGMSKMLGQSLMEHEMMQQMLREVMNNGNVGSAAKKQLQNIDKMLEKTRKELMNKNLSNRTLMRQNQILTRLLEAEKAEMERDIDNKRESETADEEFYSNPVKYFEYNKNEISGFENIEKNVYKLNNFYNIKYKKYIKSINGQGVQK